LGGLFVIVPGRLHPLWYTQFLPVLFYISAIAAGFSMVIVESTLAAKAFKRHTESHLLSEIGSWIPYALILYLVLNLGILIFSGDVAYLFTGSIASVLYLLEILGGIVLPLVLLLIPSIRHSTWGLFWAAVLVVVGVVFNRFNVAFFGQAGAFYLPSWIELGVTVGLISLGMLIYMFGVKNFSVLDQTWDDTH
jgi:Ni/Fe-hydrogenase subunit HybB-like protein